MKHNFPLIITLLSILLLLSIQQTSVAQRNKRLKTKNKPITYELFMLNKRANIGFLPTQESDSTKGGYVVTETVDYRNEDNYSKTLSQQDEAVEKGSLSDLQTIGEVVVTARRRFVPERDGYINIEFLIDVPKELISDKWRLTLSPKLINGDSITEMGNVLLKGADFVAMQQDEKERYKEYKSSIVPEGDYDRVFSDDVNIEKDINSQLDFYWELYHKEWKQRDKYLKWEKLMQARYDRSNLTQKQALMELEYDLKRQAWFEAERNHILGVDTTGVQQKYAKKFERKSKFWPKYRLKRELTEDKVPKKYRRYFAEDIRPENTHNYVLTQEDSAKIASFRYRFDLIAENEQKRENLEDVYASTVIYPKEYSVHLDSTVTTGTDFQYLYQYRYPITAAVGDLKVTMEGVVEAVDRSSYMQNASDTLSYLVSSLVQLVDTTLVTKQTKFYRNMYDKITIQPKFRPNSTLFDVKYGDNNKQIDTLLNSMATLVSKYEVQLDSVDIAVYTDLRGRYESNAILTLNMGESIKSYLVENNRGLIENPSDRIKVEYGGEDWQSLAGMVQKSNYINNKREILNLLKNAIDPDTTKQELKKLYALDYEFIKDSIFPELNRTDVLIYVSRPEMSMADSVHSEYRPEYAEGIKLLKERKYWDALEILSNYPDYNLALCLACMGYNGKAYDLLVQLSPNANVEYLKAIVLVRLDKEEQAVEHLIKAGVMDEVKLSRASLDSETAGLLAKYNIVESIRDQKSGASH